MDEPTTYLTHPTTTTTTTALHHIPLQRPPLSSTTMTTVYKTRSKDAAAAVGARLVGSKSEDNIGKCVGRDQDTYDINGSSQQIQATAKVVVVSAELESVLKSVVSRPPSSSSLKDTMNATATTTTTTTAAGVGVGFGRDDEQLVESPQIVRSASLRTCTLLSPVQQGPVQAASVPVVVSPVKRAQEVAKDAQKSQSQVQQIQQAQTITTTPSVQTTTLTTGGGHNYSPPRQHIYYSHTPHSHSQHHHHHHRLHHHHHQHHHSHQHHQHGSSTGSNGGGSSEKQKKNRRFSYSKVGASPSPATPQDSKVNSNSNNAAGPGQAATGEERLNRAIGGVGDNNGSLGLLVDPAPKCCKIRPLNPQLSVTTSPIPSPSLSPFNSSSSSRAFASMPSTASPETAGLSPTSAAMATRTKDTPSGSGSGSSDASTFDSPSSSSSSMTSVSPSSITEHSYSFSSGKGHSTVPNELRGIDQRRQEKEMVGKKVDSIGNDGTIGGSHVTGSLATQQQQEYRAQGGSDNGTSHQQDHIIQEDSLVLGVKHPLELYRQVLPPTSADLHPLQHQQHHEEHGHDHDHDLYIRPRVCKMVVKHPFVKLDWKVPEPIKAGGEVLRGVLIITAKEWQDSEVKAAAKSKSQGKKGGGGAGGGKKGKKMKLKQDRYVWIDHIEVDLTGLEEVTTGAGLLSRTRTDRHCFLHKTQVLPIEELKCIFDISSSSSSSSSSSTPTTSFHTATSTSSQSGNGTQSTSTCAPIPSRSSSLIHSSSSLTDTDLAKPGKLGPGTQQGISFQMRIPERVGGTYRNAHASITYQLTANVHIRRGKEMFVLQHPLPLSLFELVQVRAATKITSPHDTNPSSSNTTSRTMTGTSASSASFTSSTTTASPSSIAAARRQAGVRFVIPKANSVLGTAAVKPYSLWGLGPATSSSSTSSHHGHSGGHGYRRQSHQRRGSLTVPSGSASSSASTSTGGVGTSGSGMTRSYSDIGALTSQLHSKDESSSSPSSSSNTTTSLKKARFDPDEMLSAEDQYRSRQKQQQQELELQQQQQGSRPKLGPRKDSTDGLDEVGFGAHIDKSVAAAGENVTMDMFVVKSDMMKVVDIKVSLVETIQVFSLLENESSCAVVSPIVARTHVFDQQHQHQHAGAAGSSKRKLVETHMVKIAKAYVPAQAEESHANDNHLKGYYEDYEDARTTKSLSMYKLGMRIPETALTIQDRDLFKVDYMFVIKFFFKGRMGAFLELPIEIVSQYNHNRISTISGAISCVSNSVQIALPPVPILVKRHDSGGASTATATATATILPGVNKDIAAVGGVGEAGGAAAEQGIAASAKYTPEDDENEEMEGAGAVVSGSQGAEEIQGSPAGHQKVKDAAIDSSDPSTSKNGASQGYDLTAQDASTAADISATVGAGPEGAENAPGTKDKMEDDSFGTDNTDTLNAEEDGILASSRLSKAEFEACASRQVGLAVARYNSMSSTTGKTGAAPHVTTPAASIKDIKKIKPTPTIAGATDGVPKIVIETFKQPKSGPHGPASSFTTSTSTSSSNSSTMSTTTTTTVISPALPILFDLTSAALPTSAPSTVAPPIPTPLVIPRTLGGPTATTATTTTVMTPGLRSSSMGATGVTGTVPSFPMADTIKHSNSFPRSAKDTELQLPNLQPLRQGTNASREDDYPRHHQGHVHHYGHHLETEGTKSGSIVSKIAKSLSSPLLRSRAGSASPNGSQSNLAIVSPQQQSSAFTLAATTLSALTLLSAVGQAAVSSEGKKMSPASQLPRRPLKSCIKKRSTTTRPLGLITGNLNVTGSGHGRVVAGGGGGLSSATPGHPGQQHPYSASNTSRKKVTFAKGLTPVPSPTGSQIMLSEPIVLEPFKYKNNYPSSSASSSSSSTSTTTGMFTNSGLATGTGTLLVPGLTTSVRTNPVVAAVAAPMTTTRPLVSTLNQQHNLPPQQQWQQSAVANPLSTPHPTIAAPAPSAAGHPAPVRPGMSTMGPNSASPRTRMHHPFDSHPSRLSPLEKKHLDFQIQDLKSSRSHGSAIKAAVSFKGVVVSSDDEEEEECEEYGEGEEEGDEEDDDEEEDDQESEEERIERRRQVRIAWLAKYGDAFKQVYGAVPELPPL
ncbi:MAG: hypothetical protein J3R72DRAFT_101396 [Linnemannia gamsii]|nr:MAG: hypothetical protein J3R72DRAFT_101396 [Linnemannia gamsii]